MYTRVRVWISYCIEQRQKAEFTEEIFLSPQMISLHFLLPLLPSSRRDLILTAQLCFCLLEPTRFHTRDEAAASPRLALSPTKNPFWLLFFVFSPLPVVLHSDSLSHRQD